MNELLPGGAVPLAHAVAHRIAAERGIRLLSIKGPVADAYGLRPPRVAADADVLADPARVDDLRVALAVAGWTERVERDTPAVMRPHSHTLIHRAWPCDIDVHRYFPGFYAPDDVVFERLWQGRERWWLAHLPVWVPARADAAVVQALHAVRYVRSERHHADAGAVRALLRGEAVTVEARARGFSTAECERFAATTAIGRARWVLRDVTDGILPLLDDLDERQRAEWDLNRRTIEDGSTASWLLAVRRAPFWRRPGVVWRAVWIARADIPRNDSERMPTHREALAHRWHRWVKGVSTLGRYIAERANRRGR